MPIDDYLEKLSDGHVGIFLGEKRKTTVPKEFSIQETEEFYIINGVKINNEIKTVKWTKKLLDKGKNHTQDEWVQGTKYSETKLASLPTYIATIITLYDNQNIEDQEQKDLVEKVRKMFETDFNPQNPWMMTSTRITYYTQGPDRISHDYGYDNESKINDKEIIGPSNWINQSSGLEQTTQAIIENDDLDKIERAIEWISTKKPYLWRFNQKPQQIDQRAVVLGRYISIDAGFNIVCDVNISDDGPARGVVVVDAPKKELQN